MSTETKIDTTANAHGQIEHQAIEFAYAGDGAGLVAFNYDKEVDGVYETTLLTEEVDDDGNSLGFAKVTITTEPMTYEEAKKFNAEAKMSTLIEGWKDWPEKPAAGGAA